MTDPTRAQFLSIVAGQRYGALMAFMTMYTIYCQNLPGGPDVFSMRPVFIGRPGYDPLKPAVGEVIIVADSLEEVRGHVPPEADFCLAREAGDDPAIIETWM